jgi:hypothetical protein
MAGSRHYTGSTISYICDLRKLADIFCARVLDGSIMKFMSQNRTCYSSSRLHILILLYFPSLLIWRLGDHLTTSLPLNSMLAQALSIELGVWKGVTYHLGWRWLHINRFRLSRLWISHSLHCSNWLPVYYKAFQWNSCPFPESPSKSLSDFETVSIVHNSPKIADMI